MHVLARATLYLLLATPFAAAIASGCSESDGGGGSTSNTQSTGSATTGSASSAAGGAGGTSASSGTATSVGGAGVGGASTTTTGTAGGGPLVPATCQGKVYFCGDTLDNDNDGLIDSMDPDCTGPCDNTEDGYIIGIPGSAGPGCTQDCYWDNDSGTGNDDCYWNHKCDEHEADPNWYPESYLGMMCAYDPNANTPGTGGSCDELYTTQSQECYDICGPLTPNGCDCFGCCELPLNPGSYVWIGSNEAGTGTCDPSKLMNPDDCEPCKPVAACLNECGLCEICIGKPTLPPECYPDGGGTGGGDGGTNTEQCPPPLQACGLPGQPLCPPGYYCITGCCIEAPP